MRATGPIIPGGIMCRDVVELVTDYLDDALSRDAGARMDDHLQACGACVEYVDQVRSTGMIAAVAAVELQLRPDRDALLQAFREFKPGR